MDRHPEDYEDFSAHSLGMITAPDYILEANKPHTALVLKHIAVDDMIVKAVLRLATSTDDPAYKNSIIIMMKIDEKDWKRLVRNKRILYKKE